MTEYKDPRNDRWSSVGAGGLKMLVRAAILAAGLSVLCHDEQFVELRDEVSTVGLSPAPDLSARLARNLGRT